MREYADGLMDVQMCEYADVQMEKYIMDIQMIEVTEIRFENLHICAFAN